MSADCRPFCCPSTCPAVHLSVLLSISLYCYPAVRPVVFHVSCCHQFVLVSFECVLLSTVHLAVLLFVLFVSLSCCTSVHPAVLQSILLSFSPSCCPSVHPAVHQSVLLYFHVSCRPQVSPPIHSAIHASELFSLHQICMSEWPEIIRNSKLEATVFEDAERFGHDFPL